MSRKTISSTGSGSCDTGSAPLSIISGEDLKRLKHQLLTPEQAGELLGVGLDCLAQWRVAKKYIPYLKVGRLVRYRLPDVLAFLDSQVVEVAQ